MIIGINASFSRKASTGIGQVTINFLKKLIEIQSEKLEGKNFEFIIYLEDDVDLKLPKNFKKNIFLPVWKRDDLLRKIWWEKYSLPKKIQDDKCDVLISLYQSATITPRDIKHIMIVHDIIPKIFLGYLNNFRKKSYWKLTEKAIKSANKIIAVSKRTEKDLIQHLDINPSMITVSHIDVDNIYKQEVTEENSRRIMKKFELTPGYIYTGGGLEMRKNIDKLLRAYKMLLERNKKEYFINDFPELVITGKLLPQLAPLVLDVEKLTKELNLTEHVRILGFVAQDDLPAIYKNAKLFVYPSLYEGFGIPVLEAMNLAVPVITSKNSSMPEVGGDSVLYCEPGDTKDIAMTIKNALINKEIRNTLSARGYDRARIFSWKNFVEKVINIIQA